MRYVMVALLAAVMFLSGCGQSGPVGTWVIDPDAMFAAMEKAMGKDMPEGFKPMLENARAELRKNAPDITMTLRSDGSYEMANGRETRKGTWKIDGGKLSMTEERGPTTSTDVRFEGGRMYLAPPQRAREMSPLGKVELVFKRK